MARMNSMLVLTLVLGGVILLSVYLAVRVDDVVVKPPNPDDDGGNDDDNNNDDATYLSLMLRRGDNISTKLGELLERARGQETDSSSEDYKRFVRLLGDMYDEYDTRGPTTGDGGGGDGSSATTDSKEGGSGSVVDAPAPAPDRGDQGVAGVTDIQSDSPGVLMYRDELPPDDKIDETRQKVDQTGDTVNRLPVPGPLRDELNRMLSRGRRILEHYRELNRRYVAKGSQIDDLNTRVRDLDDERARLRASNDELRAQLTASGRRTDQLQRSYDDADRKLAELQRAYDEQAAELREDEERLRAVEQECQSKSSELRQAVQRSQENNQQIDQLSSSLREKSDTEDRLKQEIDRRASEFAGKSREQEESCSRLRAELDRAVAEKRDDAEKLHRQLQQQEARLAEEGQKHRGEINELERQLQENKRDVEGLTGQLRDSQQKYAYESERANSLEAQVAGLKEMLAATAKQFDQKVENVDDANKLMESLKGQCKLYQDSLTSEKEQLANAQARLHEYEQRVADVEKKLADAQGQLDDKLQALEYERGEFEAYKERFNAKATERLRGQMMERLQKESDGKLACLNELASKEATLMEQQDRLREQIRDLKIRLNKYLPVKLPLDGP